MNLLLLVHFVLKKDIKIILQIGYKYVRNVPHSTQGPSFSSTAVHRGTRDCGKSMVM